MKEKHAEIDAIFSASSVMDEMTKPRFERLREVGRAFAHGLVEVVPAGVEQDRAIMAVREAMMFAEAGIKIGRPAGPSRITAARVSEADAVKLRDAEV